MKRIGRIGLIGLMGLVLAGCLCVPAMAQDVAGGSASTFTNVPAADVPAAAVNAAREATPVIVSLAQKYSWLMMALSVIGLLRVVCKPIISFIEAGIKLGPGSHNPVWLQRCQQSATVRWMVWLVDWLGSIKPPSMATTNPSLNGGGQSQRSYSLAVAGLLIGLCGCVVTGCMSGNADTIRGPGGLALKLPRDATFGYLEYRQPVALTNGQVGQALLIITNGSFKMNPDVIDAKTRRDIQLIQAGANVGGQMINYGLKGAGIPTP